MFLLFVSFASCHGLWCVPTRYMTTPVHDRRFKTTFWFGQRMPGINEDIQCAARSLVHELGDVLRQSYEEWINSPTFSCIEWQLFGPPPGPDAYAMIAPVFEYKTELLGIVPMYGPCWTRCNVSFVTTTPFRRLLKFRRKMTEDEMDVSLRQSHYFCYEMERQIVRYVYDVPVDPIMLARTAFGRLGRLGLGPQIVRPVECSDDLYSGDRFPSMEAIHF
jgi:hypothetical protein